MSSNKLISTTQPCLDPNDTTCNVKTVGPYFNTTFSTSIGLHPSQMTKKIYENLKSNLIVQFQNKCFKSYGYISKIYNITKQEGGRIISENPDSIAVFRVEFLCKLCRPLKNSYIVCEVKKINRDAMYLVNGPIQAFILDVNLQINQQNIVYNENKNVFIGHDYINKTEVKIVEGSYVKVKCIDVRIEHGTDRIIIIGIVDSIPTQEEINNSTIEKETDELKYYAYDEYVKENEETVQETDENKNDNEIVEISDTEDV